MPLIEYCPMVWHQERTSHINRLEKYLHKATRIALGSEYRPPCYEQRVRSLNLLTLQQRRIIAILIAVIKILRGESCPGLTRILQRFTRGASSTRTQRVFNIPNANVLPKGSPLQLAMQAINTYHRVINIEEAIPTIRSKLKDYFRSDARR